MRVNFSLQKSHNSDSPRTPKEALKIGDKWGLSGKILPETIPEWETPSSLHLPAEGETSPQVGIKLVPQPGFFPWSTSITRPALQTSLYVLAPLGEVAPLEEAAKSPGPEGLAWAALGTLKLEHPLCSGWRATSSLPVSFRRFWKRCSREALVNDTNSERFPPPHAIPSLNPVWTSQRPCSILDPTRGSYIKLSGKIQDAQFNLNFR